MSSSGSPPAAAPIVSGIDAAEGMLAVARAAVPAADLRLGGMEDLPWEDGAFDVVTGFNAFQFAADTTAALAEAARVVRPGGLVAVANWGRAEEQELAAVMTAARPLLPPSRTHRRPDRRSASRASSKGLRTPSG